MRFLPILFILLFSSAPSVLFAATQTQGFTKWDEATRSFECDSSCFLLLGPPTAGFLELEAQTEGQGIMAYGYLIDNQITPIGSLPVTPNLSLTSELSLHPQFSFLSTKPVVIILQGKLKGSFSKIGFRSVTFSEKMGLRFHEFATLRPFGPATINLLYGPYWGEKSANNLFYIIFFIGSILVFLLVKKEKRVLTVGILALSLWVIYDIRMSAEIMKTHMTDISSLNSNTSFRDRGDFYQFVDFAKTELERRGIEKSKTLSFYSDNTWPFPDSVRYFLYPHKVLIKNPADILLVYGYTPLSINSSGITLSGAFLGTGEIIPFSPEAFIFSRKL